MSAETSWPNVLADLEIKRDAIVQMIDIVRTHFVGDTPGEMPDSTPARGTARTKSAKRPPMARCRPDNLFTDNPIIAILTKHGGSMKPGELARAMKVPGEHALP